MKIALAQMKTTAYMEDNFQKSVRLAERAAAEGADLICYPEIQLSPFFPQYPSRDASAYLLSRDSRYIREFCDVCRKNGIYASPNFYVEENEHRYDMSFLIDDGGTILGTQKMVHIAECEQFYEQDYYTPSDDGFSVFDTRFGKIGIVVCFDRHYPESIRTEALRGAELILIPTANTKAEPAEMFRWEIRTQAFQNIVNIAMCNRCGTEGQMEFSGESLVSDFDGNLTTLAGDQEELLIAETDLAGCAARRKTRPYLSLRRPEHYA